MRVLIIGATGFIGSSLFRELEARGHSVVGLSRSGKLAPDLRGGVFKWRFGDVIPAEACTDAEVAIHLAHDFDGKRGADRTFAETLNCAKQLREAGVLRQLYFSSYSAGPHAKSIYGRTKWGIEKALATGGDVFVVRPGLVLGDGGIYGRISKVVGKFPVLPLPDGGRGRVPVITIERLCTEVASIVAGPDVAGEANLFESKMSSLKELVLGVAMARGKRPFILFLPFSFFYVALRLAELLRIGAPISSDSLIGFSANQAAGHTSTIRD